MNDDVKTEETPVTEPKTEEVVTAPAPKPGEKTDSALLLQSLKEEREERRQKDARIAELEAELQAQRSTPQIGVAFSEEGKLLEAELRKIQGQMAQKEEGDRLKAVQTVYPALKDKASEFEAFRSLPENQGMRVETAAKAFVVENDLLETPKARKGLETGTGGDRQPTRVGLTLDEIDDMRQNNYREYSKRLKDGTLQINP